MTEVMHGIAPDMAEFVGEFLTEADELLAGLDADLVTLESTPQDLNLLNNIFRAAHTIKGTASFVGLEQISSLTHCMEDVLNRLRKGELTSNSQLMDVLLESVDNLKRLLADVRAENIIHRDLDGVIARLKAIDRGEGTIAVPEPAKQVGQVPEVKNESSAPSQVDAMVAELAAEREIAHEPVEKSKQAEAPATKDSSRESGKKGEQTVRVNVDRLDALMNLVGELVLGRNTLVQTNNDLSVAGLAHTDVERLGSVSSQINFITTELQTSVMKLRMLPIGKVFSRFPRLARDIASQTGKKINLEMFGEETELDKTVIEEIGDPLIHLVRNSCDHGVELPEVRRASGKSEVGRVTLKAAQQGSQILITIEDDGKGLDIEAIKAKLIEKGLASEMEVSRMSKQQICHYIFAPGFSTAKVVSDLSGRGVGMDVVRTNIEKLNGLIDLETEHGKGTKVTIRLPLTLAIIQGLLVRAHNEIYIIPLASVHDTVRVEEKDVFRVNGVEVIRLRESIMPILALPRVLRDESVRSAAPKGRYVVVVGLAEKRLGLIVDGLLGQEEVVIKSLGRVFGNTEGLAGATILGDGRIRLIADVAGLFALAKRQAKK